MIDYWKLRSLKYNKLQWANNIEYNNMMIDLCKLKKTDSILDVGCGSGMFIEMIEPLVDNAIGLDLSKDMLEKSRHRKSNLINSDARNMPFLDNTFDKIVCSHVFHHILEHGQKAMDECYRVLKKNGIMVFSEGIPPSERTRKDYIEIFKLKEKRITFSIQELHDLMSNAGFKNIKNKIFTVRDNSVKKWLTNNSLPKDLIEKIYNLHKYASQEFKKDYNMTETEDDCCIDIKIAILVGKK